MRLHTQKILSRQTAHFTPETTWDPMIAGPDTNTAIRQGVANSVIDRWLDGVEVSQGQSYELAGTDAAGRYVQTDAVQ